MMKSRKNIWEIRWTKASQKNLSKIPLKDTERILNKIDTLLENPYQGKFLKGEFSEYFRIVISNYRVIYQVRSKELIILIVKIGHRKEIY